MRETKGRADGTRGGEARARAARHLTGVGRALQLRHARGRHFGRWAKASERPARQYAGHEQASLQRKPLISSAVPPAASGVGGWPQPGTADPSLQAHQRRSASGCQRGGYRNGKERPRARPARPRVASCPHTDSRLPSAGASGSGRAGVAIPVRPHYCLGVVHV